jgi:hypothetical protein
MTPKDEEEQDLRIKLMKTQIRSLRQQMRRDVLYLWIAFIVAVSAGVTAVTLIAPHLQWVTSHVP